MKDQDLNNNNKTNESNVKKDGLFTKMFTKKKIVDDFTNEMNQPQNIEMPSTGLSGLALDEALEMLNENEKIKDILAQPTEEINHLLEQIDQDCENVDIKHVREDSNQEMIEEVTSLKTTPETISNIDTLDLIQDIETVDLENLFLHIKPIVDYHTEYEKINISKSNRQLVEEVELPDTILTEKFITYLDDVFINEDLATIKKATFEFMYEEIAKIIKHAKDKITENDIEVQMLQEEIKRREDKIRILQEQNGNPLEYFNRYKTNLEHKDE